jgi:hypothetical protein
MTTNQLYQLIHAAPIQPFVIHMVDGRELFVPHPDFIAHRQRGRIAVVLRDDDTASYLDVLMITELETRPPASAAPGPP